MDDLRFRRVHVAGAGGLLGTAVAGELEAAGHELLHATAPVDAVVHCPAPEPPGRLTHRRLASPRPPAARRRVRGPWPRTPSSPTPGSSTWGRPSHGATTARAGSTR